MSFLDALQNGQRIASLPSKADVKINLGNGNSVIKVSAKSADIDTGCGDQDITVLVTDDLSIDTGHCGEDTINAVVGGNAKITTREDNDYVNLYVDGGFKVDVGSNHPPCVEGNDEYTDNDIVMIHGNLEDTESKNFVSTGEGTDNVRIIGNNVDVKKADGKLTLGFFGDNYNVNSDAEQNTVGFWGDDVTINITGQGPQDIKTLDFSFEEGRFLDFGFEDLLAQKTYAGRTIDTVVTETLTGKDNLEEVAKQYNLTDEQIAQLRELDLTKTTEKGNPYYILYKSGNSYQIGYRDDANNVYGLCGKKLTGSTSYTSTSYSTQTSSRVPIIVKVNHQYIIVGYKESGTTTATTTTTSSTTSLSKMVNLDIEREHELAKEIEVTDYYAIDGVKNTNINFLNNGKYNVGITASDGYININGQNACYNDIIQNIVVRNGYVVTDKASTEEVSYIVEKLGLSAGNLSTNTSSTSNSNSSKWSNTTSIFDKSDPLVLDTNKDGIISSIKNNTGYGVDINGNGVGDGAATDGDKMLAMSDLNGNGKIDGAEVFGNYTVSPFSKKTLNAANGFEALKMIAQEAKEYTGVDCMNGNSVDIQKLAEVLEKQGVKLGLVGDNNTTALDDLGDIKSINIGYKSVKEDEADKIKHNEISTYTTTDGKKYMVHDVTF